MSSVKDPKGLGKIVVAAAGMPVPVQATSFMVSEASFQADPLNVGTYMLLKDSAGNLMARWQKGQSYTPPHQGAFDLASLQFDSDTNGDGAIVSYV